MLQITRALSAIGLIMALAYISLNSGPAGPLHWHDTGPLLHLRQSRVLMALAEGSGLGLSGLLMQSLFRNPLVDASLLGVAPATSLGGLLFLLAGAPLWTASLAACGAALVVLMLLLGAMRGTSSLTRVLLIGLALNAVLGAFLQFLLMLLPSDRLVGAWSALQGSFADVRRSHAILLLLLVLLIAAWVWRQRRPLDWLLLGPAVARSAGIDVERLQRRMVLLAAALTAALVSQAGLVGFIGMMAPALVRWSLPGGHGRWLPWSMVAGCLLALLADILARWLWAPAELPVGIVTSLLGAPVFLFLLLMQYRERSS